MTYSEVLEWLDDNDFFNSDLDIEDLYNAIGENWDGRDDFSNIMTLDQFANEFENYNNLQNEE